MAARSVARDLYIARPSPSVPRSTAALLRAVSQPYPGAVMLSKAKHPRLLLETPEDHYFQIPDNRTAIAIASTIARLDTPRVAMSEDLTFDEFAQWLPEYWRVPNRKAITPETQFERDLGLTGDDGDELLIAAEKRFEVRLGSEETGVRETFNLQPKEYLFHSEGWGPSPAEFISLFSDTPAFVRSFEVGELFEAIMRIKNQKR